MHSSELLSKAWCDQVFEGRNKAYGAYRIRSLAGHRYRWALAVVVGTFALFAVTCTGVALYARYLIANEIKETAKALSEVKFSDLKEGYKVKFVATARLAPSKRMDPGATESVPEIVDGEPPLPVIGAKGPVAYDPEQDVITSPIIDTTGLSDEDLPMAKEKIVPTDVVSQIPEFPGGARAFMRWLNDQVVYPRQCISRGEQGTVTVCFIIGIDGRATEVEIKDAFNRQVRKMIADALERMPQWKPGTDECGRPTPVKVTVPIEFKI